MCSFAGCFRHRFREPSGTFREPAFFNVAKHDRTSATPNLFEYLLMPALSLSLCTYIYVLYVYLPVFVYTHMYIYYTYLYRPGGARPSRAEQGKAKQARTGQGEARRGRAGILSVGRCGLTCLVLPHSEPLLRMRPPVANKTRHLDACGAHGLTPASSADGARCWPPCPPTPHSSSWSPLPCVWRGMPP